MKINDLVNQEITVGCSVVHISNSAGSIYGRKGVVLEIDEEKAKKPRYYTSLTARCVRVDHGDGHIAVYSPNRLVVTEVANEEK